MLSRLEALDRRTFLSFLLLLIVAGGFLVYGASLGNPFVDYDDTRFVVENPLIQTLSLENLRAIFGNYERVLYVPLFFLSLALDYAFGGLWPFTYHLSSLLLHIAAAFLVAVLAVQVTRSNTVALLTSLVFLVHPLQTEAVAWVSARKDLLAGVFVLGSACLYLASHGGARRSLLAGSIALFACSLLSKPAYILLPLLLPLLDHLQGRAWKRRRIAALLPYVLLATAALVVGLFGGTQVTRIAASTSWEKLLLAARSLLSLLRRIVWPFDLSVLIPVTDAIALTSLSFGAAVLALGALAAVLWYVRRSAPELVVAAIVFVALLLPAFGAFHTGEDFGDVQLAADRYAYVALAAVCIGVCALAVRLLRGRSRSIESVVLSVVLLLTVGLGALATAQARTWRSTRTLFAQALRAYPNAQVAHLNLGVLAYRQGLLAQAVEHYQASIAIRPTMVAYANLGEALDASGRLDEALAAYAKVLEGNPLHAPVHLQVGRLHWRRGDLDAARASFEAAAKADPLSPVPHGNIGLLEEERGNIREALEAFDRGLALAPDDPELRAFRERVEQEMEE